MRRRKRRLRRLVKLGAAKLFRFLHMFQVAGSFPNVDVPEEMTGCRGGLWKGRGFLEWRRMLQHRSSVPPPSRARSNLPN